MAALRPGGFELPWAVSCSSFAIVALICVEIVHLKWIWWTEWHCRRCGERNNVCRHGAKWMFLL
jgi:hypothetical protein